MPDLLDQVDREINRFVGDGIYDREPVYEAVPYGESAELATAWHVDPAHSTTRMPGEQARRIAAHE